MAMHQNQKLPSLRHLSQRRRRRHFEEKAVQWCCSNEKRLTVVGALISRRWADSRSKICYSQTSNRNHLRQRLLSCSGSRTQLSACPKILMISLPHFIH